MQAAYIATAKWMVALGLEDSLALLSPFLCSNSNAAAALSATQKSSAGTVLRRPFAVASSGWNSQPKTPKIRDTLFSLMALVMPVDPSQQGLLLLALVPHLLDALQPQQRSDSLVSSSAASTLLSLVAHEAASPESIVEVMQQRTTGHGAHAASALPPEAALKQLLIPAESLALLLRARQETRASSQSPLLRTLPLPTKTSSKTPHLQQQEQQEQPKGEDVVSEESIQATTPAIIAEASTAIPAAELSSVLLSTRSQRIHRSSGAGFVTVRRQPFSVREELHQELKNRFESSLLLLMFPPSSSSATQNKQAVPELSQLRAIYDEWKRIFDPGNNAAASSREDGSPMPPLTGEQSITDILLKWIAFW